MSDHNSQSEFVSEITLSSTPSNINPDINVLYESFEEDRILNVDELKDEQKTIDSTLNFLLNFPCNKRKPGRPTTKNESTPQSTIPKTVNESFKSITDIKSLHPGVLLDYLHKINNLNKKILVNFEILNNKYNDLINKQVLTNNSQPPPPSSNQPIIADNSQLLNLESDVLNSGVSKSNDEKVVVKLDDLEQRLNSNVLICSGPAISNFTNETSLTNLKNDVCNEIKNLVPSKSPDEFSSVVLIGKNKNKIKIICRTESVKNEILYEARKKKLNTIYFSEFLTLRRSALFYELRQLKKSISDKLYATYTRRGNIYYKLRPSDDHVRVKDFGDI